MTNNPKTHNIIKRTHLHTCDVHHIPIPLLNFNSKNKYENQIRHTHTYRKDLNLIQKCKECYEYFKTTIFPSPGPHDPYHSNHRCYMDDGIGRAYISDRFEVSKCIANERNIETKMAQPVILTVTNNKRKRYIRKGSNNNNKNNNNKIKDNDKISKKFKPWNNSINYLYRGSDNENFQKKDYSKLSSKNLKFSEKNNMDKNDGLLWIKKIKDKCFKNKNNNNINDNNSNISNDKGINVSEEGHRGPWS